MIIELGHYSFILSFFLSLTYPIFLFQSAYRKYALDKLYLLILINFVLISISMLCLCICFILSDFSIINIIEHSHSDLPLIFKISAMWGNHEGSILLWTWIISFYSMIYCIYYTRTESTLPISTVQLSIQGTILLFFISFTEFSSNPFLTVCLPFENGGELNPVLQDPVLAIHPPLIYFGYIGSIVPFSILMSSLILRYEHKWIFFTAQVWSIMTWSFLSLGILLGSWWAYYELGWGGWWFWDPVENSSLVPWVFGTSLIHAFLYSSLWTRFWTILLSFFTFLSSILGTFFVRSGFLESVHSFANDSSRGVFLFFFFIGVVIFSFLVLYTNRHYLVIFLREEKLHLGNIQLSILSLMSLVILFGTFYPFLYKIIFDESISVGSSFFNGLIGPIVGSFILLMCLMYLSWNGARPKLSVLNSFIISFLLGGWSLLFFKGILNHHENLSTIYLGIITIFGILLVTYHIFNSFFVHIGMVLSHLGFLLFFLGAIFSSSFQHEISQVLHIGDTLHFRDFDYVLQSTNLLDGPNYTSFYGTLVQLKEGAPTVSFYPEKRYYYIQGFYATKPYVISSLAKDFYVLIGDGNPLDGWEIKIYENPAMSWIWIGGLLVIVGGVYSFFSPRRKEEK